MYIKPSRYNINIVEKVWGVLKAQFARAQARMMAEEQANANFADLVRQEIPLFQGRTDGKKFSEHALRQMLAVFQGVLL